MAEADIRHMDALELLRSMPDKSVSAVITDPPYGTTNNSWDTAPDWSEFIRESLRVSRGVVAVFSQLPVACDVIAADRKHYRYDIVWHKNRKQGFLDANRRPLRAHENILIFSDNGFGEYHPQKVAGFKPYRHRKSENRAKCYGSINAYTQVNDGTRHPEDVLDFKSESRSVHPTQKPLDLLRWLVRTYSSEGGTILDPYLGSGTTAVAALLENRNVIGSELESEYISLIHRRLETEAGQTSLSLEA